ncbi:MAG: hypothetical protein WCT22_03275 [Patescibacteria group bacterium]|jgi:hypothetical protein
MKSLARRFKNITEKNPFWSSLACFAEAVKRQGFRRDTIHRWFLKLVEKDDYEMGDKKDILAHAEELSKAVEDNKKQGQFCPPRS